MIAPSPSATPLVGPMSVISTSCWFPYWKSNRNKGKRRFNSSVLNQVTQHRISLSKSMNPALPKHSQTVEKTMLVSCYPLLTTHSIKLPMLASLLIFPSHTSFAPSPPLSIIIPLRPNHFSSTTAAFGFGFQVDEANKGKHQGREGHTDFAISSWISTGASQRSGDLLSCCTWRPILLYSPFSTLYGFAIPLCMRSQEYIMWFYWMRQKAGTELNNRFSFSHLPGTSQTSASAQHRGRDCTLTLIDIRAFSYVPSSLNCLLGAIRVYLTIS